MCFRSTITLGLVEVTRNTCERSHKHTCHVRKSLRRLTPLVRISMSTGGLSTTDVMICASISSCVKTLQVVEWVVHLIYNWSVSPCLPIPQGFADWSFYCGCYVISAGVWHANVEYSSSTWWGYVTTGRIRDFYLLLWRVISSAFFIASCTEGGKRSFLPTTFNRMPCWSRSSLSG